MSFTGSQCLNIYRRLHFYAFSWQRIQQSAQPNRTAGSIRCIPPANRNNKVVIVLVIARKGDFYNQRIYLVSLRIRMLFRLNYYEPVKAVTRPEVRSVFLLLCCPNALNPVNSNRRIFRSLARRRLRSDG